MYRLLPRLLLLSPLVLGGCAGQPAAVSKEQVRVVTAEELQQCTNVGAAHVSVMDRYEQLRQSEGRVEEALLDLARGSAVQLGGNALVEMTNIQDGNQSFAVFRCK